MRKGEHHLRSFAKAFSWRILATLTTAILVYIFTGSFALTIAVGSLEFFIKILIYYLHERIWNGVGWGKP